MCHELFALCQKTNARSISKDDVESILDDVIERGTVNLKFVWDEANDLEKWILAGLAQLDGAASAQKLSQLLQKQRVRFSEPDLNSAILHLRDKDVISKENQLIIHLMRMWLHANRPLDRVREELAEVNPIANRYIEIGDEYRDLGENQQAIESYQQALSVDPGNLKAQSSIGTAHLKGRAFKEAVAAFESALQIDDEDVVSRTGFCDANLALGDQARANDDKIGLFQKILLINPAHSDARQRLAGIYSTRAEELLTAGKDDEALSSFNQAIDFIPDDDQLINRYEEVLEEKKAKIVAEWLDKAERAVSRKRWDDAANAVEAALRLDPENTDLLAKLEEVKDAPRQSKIKVYKDEAEEAIRRGNFEKAIAAIETARQLAPEDSSLAEWLEAIRTDQINTRLKIFRDQAQKAISGGDWDTAISARKAALKVSPNDPTLQREYAETEASKQQAQLDALQFQAEQAIRVEDWDTAINAYKSARKLASDDPAWEEKIEETQAAKLQAQLDAFQKQADEAVAGGDWEAAIQAVREAIKFAPDSAPWKDKLSEIEASRHQAQLEAFRVEADSAKTAKDWDVAITALEQYLKLEPSKVKIQSEIETLRVEKRQSHLVEFKSQAEKAVQNEKWDQAVKSWENYLALDPEDQTLIESALQHARKYAQISGDYAEAQKAIRKKRYGRAIQLLQGIIAQEPTYKSTSRLLVEAVEANEAIPVWRRRWVIPGLGIVVLAILGIMLGPQVSEIISSAQQPDPSPAWAEIILEYINDTSPDFEDDFSTVKADWSHVLFDADVPDANLGAYIRDGVFIAKRTGTESWVEINLGDVQGNNPLFGEDFALQLDVTAIELGEHAVFIMYYRTENPFGHFAFSINGNGDWSVGFEDRDLGGEEIISGQTKLFRMGESNQFQLLALGDEVAIYLNEILLTNFQYGLESFGQYINFGFGSATESFQGNIDNVKFWNLAEPIPDEEPKQEIQIVVESIAEFIASQLPTFEDDFSTHKSEWMLPSGASIDSGTLIMNVEHDEDLFFGGNHLSASDFVIQYDFKVEGNDGTSMGFEIRNFTFLFEIVDGWLVSNGAESRHGELQDFRFGDWNNLIIFAQANRFEFYLNDELFTWFNETIPGDDNSLHADAVQQGKVTIDNLKFWNLDTVNLMVQGELPIPEPTPAFYEPILAYIGSEATTFEDDFSAQKAEWGRTSEGNYIFDLMEDERLLISDSFNYEYEGSSFLPDVGLPGLSFPINGLFDATNFALSFDFNNVDLEWVGLQFRGTPSELAFYEIMVSQDGQWTLMKEPGENLIAEGNLFLSAEYSTLLVIAHHDNLAIWLGNNLLMDSNVLTIRGATNKIKVNNTNDGAFARFDDIKFWDLDGVYLDVFATESIPGSFRPIQDYVGSQTPTFEDDFSVADNVWGSTSEGTAIFSLVDGGVLNITDQADEVSGTGDRTVPGLTFPTNGMLNSEDFTLDFDFKFDSLVGIGIVFRSSSPQDVGYKFNISSAGAWALTQNNGTTVIAEDLIWLEDKFNTLRLSVYGQNVAIYLDQNLIYAGDDLSVSGDFNAITVTGSAGSDGEFDNVKFWNLDGVDLEPDKADQTAPIFEYIAQKTPTYENDFSTSDPNWESAEVEDDVLKVEMGAPESLTVPNEGILNASEFALQYDFKVLQSYGLLRNFGVRFRSSENRDSFYEFKTADEEGFSRLGRFEPFGGEDISTKIPSSIANNVTHQVRIIVIENQIWIFLDDEPLFSAEDDKLSGETNFFWFDGEMGVQIDNVKFWNLVGVDFGP